jgi:hypothetical protein
MIWLQVRVLPAPPRSPLRTGVFVRWARSRIFAGLFAGELTEFGLCWGCETVHGPFRSASLWPRQTVSRRKRTLSGGASVCRRLRPVRVRREELGHCTAIFVIALACSAITGLEAAADAIRWKSTRTTRSRCAIFICQRLAAFTTAAKRSNTTWSIPKCAHRVIATSRSD